MAGLIDLLHRNWQIIHPPTPPPKTQDAIRFGILGTSRIAPHAFIRPARSHPEVVITAIAGRDRARTEAYAKRHSIPRVLDSYAALVSDAGVEAVYVPLPNGLHLEWAARALAAGKHVLVEKPGAANAGEAEELFVRGGEGGLVLLEERHTFFQPSWKVFVEQIDKGEVEEVFVTMCGMGSWFGEEDFRFDYGRGGGALLDLGTYHVACLRGIFGNEAEECIESKLTTCDPPNELCDYKFDATYRFPNGGTGRIYGNLKAGVAEMVKNYGIIYVTQRRKRVVDDDSQALPAGQEKWVRRRVTLFNFAIGAFWHRIQVDDEFEIVWAGSGKMARKWSTREVKKAYTFAEAGRPDLPGEKSWLSYRYLLEEFVNRVRGREGSGIWVTGEDSVRQMRMLDMAYEKGGLPVRKSPRFELGEAT
ncbi:hypothetical protein GE09DRAFT_1003713 [Coniochaeta sp. 2T2.1]|nr:hypothetical protein GE09DRAFT_1003713 [Coniochaeta sp. 2T2.1]